MWQVLPSWPRLSATRNRHRLRARDARGDRRQAAVLPGLTQEGIGGPGVRWQDRPQAGGLPRGGLVLRLVSRSSLLERSDERRETSLRLGTYRDLWADETTDRNVALRFLAPEQRVELAVVDASGWGSAEGRSHRALEWHERAGGGGAGERMAQGAAFLIEGTAEANANALGGRRGRGDRSAVIPLADVNFTEATWIMIVKSLVIFLVVFMIVPVLTVIERLIGRFQQRYGPNRVGPFGLLQPLADVGKLFGKEGYRRERGHEPVRSRPALVVISGSWRWRSSRSVTSRTGSASTASTSRSASSTSSPSARSPSTVCCSGLVLGLGTASRRDALGRAADLLRGGMGLALLGAIMMARLAVARRDRRVAGEIWYIVRRSSASSSSGRVRGDQPDAVRPPRGRRRAGPGVPDGVRRHRFGSFLLAEYLEVFVVSGIAVAFFLGGWMGPGPGWLDPIWMLAEDLCPARRLHLGAGDGAAAPLRPADEPRLEGAAAAGDAQRPGHRGPGGVA